MRIFRKPEPRPSRVEPAVRRRLPRRSLFPTRTLVIAGAIITGLTVLFFAAGRIQRSPQPSGEVVFVTLTQIPARAPLVPQVVQLQRVPQDRVPKDAIRSPEQLAGKAAKTPIPAGEILTEAMLIPVEEVMGVASLLSGGMQAFTVIVPEVDAAMGRISPGNRVDVLATFQQPVPATRVVAREALVISVQEVEIQLPGQTAGQGAGARPAPGGQETARLVAVTLQVPSGAVPGLVLGQHAGRLALAVYPSKGEIGPGEVEGASIPLLVGEFLPKEKTSGQGEQQVSPPPPKSYPPPPPPSLEPPGRPTQTQTVRQEVSRPARDEKPVPPPRAVIEVIRGSSVRMEVVPVGSAVPTEESVKSRTRGDETYPAPPVVIPPGQGGSEGQMQISPSPPPPPSPPQEGER